MGRKPAAGSASAVSPPAVGEIAIYICRDPVDFRMGINGLSVMVEATLKYDPFSRNLFCFVNKRRRQTTFNIPIAICSDRIPVASAAWAAVSTGPAIRSPGCCDCRCRNAVRRQPRDTRLDVFRVGLRDTDTWHAARIGGRTQ